MRSSAESCETATVRPRKRTGSAKRSAVAEHRPVSLKDLAIHLKLSPTTLSLVLNQSPGAESIPPETQERIFAAARVMNYRPDYLARSLRARRTYTVGVMVPELSDGYASLVLGGIEDYLLQKGYMYLVASHRHEAKLIDLHPRLLMERRVEGVIAVDTPLERSLPLPLVTVSGHQDLPGFTNIVLNHDKAAELALTHLFALGHRRISFLKGQRFSSDTTVRWNSIRRGARAMGLEIQRDLVAQLEGAEPSPQIGYAAASKILRAGKPFTALFAFNDISAIGAIRAFREAGLNVPEDVSVIGFDDIRSAAYHIPALTTIRQPLYRMGALAAETLLRRIGANHQPGSAESVEVDPELVVRESTCPARKLDSMRTGGP